jgi:hypothetical protein
MNCKIRYFDPAERAREKQESRDYDIARLRAGEITPEELNRENDFFASIPIEKFKIKSIGGRPFGVRTRK